MKLMDIIKSRPNIRQVRYCTQDMPNEAQREQTR